jgi:hypothetical protein
LASVGEQVDQGEAVTELLGATALGVVRPVHGVADAKEDVHLETTAWRAVGVEPKVLKQAGIVRSL